MDGIQELYVPEFYKKPIFTTFALIIGIGGLVIFFLGLILSALFGFKDLGGCAEIVGLVTFIIGVLMICLQHDLEKVNYELTGDLNTWFVIRKVIMGVICVVAGIIIGTMYIIFLTDTIWGIPFLAISVALIILGIIAAYSCLDSSNSRGSTTSNNKMK